MGCVCRSSRPGVVLVLVALAAVACSREVPAPTPSPAPSQTPAEAGPFTTARVTKIVDGATIDVEVDGRVMRVRYLGIEIPNEGAPVKDTPLAESALQYNRFLVEGRTVELEQGVSDKDPQGRLLRYVYVDGEMVNKALLVRWVRGRGRLPYRPQGKDRLRRSGRGCQERPARGLGAAAAPGWPGYPQGNSDPCTKFPRWHFAGTTGGAGPEHEMRLLGLLQRRNQGEHGPADSRAYLPRPWRTLLLHHRGLGGRRR